MNLLYVVNSNAQLLDPAKENTFLKQSQVLRKVIYKIHYVFEVYLITKTSSFVVSDFGLLWPSWPHNLTMIVFVRIHQKTLGNAVE